MSTLAVPVATAETTPLRAATRQFPESALWNDSADPDELSRSIGFGAVGATCNPVIAYTALSKHRDVWAPRIAKIAAENPTWSESQLGWSAVEALSVEAAKLLEPAFEASGGRNGRLSVQTDPRLHRDADALVEQAVRFSRLAENIIVKIPATCGRDPRDRGGHVPRREHQRHGLVQRATGGAGRRGDRTRPEPACRGRACPSVSSAPSSRSWAAGWTTGSSRWRPRSGC